MVRARQAFDQSIDYLLIQAMRGFSAYKLWVARFDGADGRPVQVPQRPASRSRGPPLAYAVRDSERLTDHFVTIVGEIAHPYQNRGPSAGAVRSHVCA
jgi:hypothetical protein